MSLGQIAALLARAVLCLRAGSTTACIALAYQVYELLGQWLADPALGEQNEHGLRVEPGETFFWDECHAADPCHDN